MKYPEFFKHIPSITLVDPLADFLGALEDGVVEFTYLDAVKLAGHSCPTIAGAYLLAYKGLNALYPDSMPLRGGIKVELKESVTEGVTGVIANVFTQITGATKESGFKGINGQFVRKALLDFDADIQGVVRFTRLDTGQSVEMIYNPVVPPDANQMPLLQKIMSHAASENDKLEFKRLWQDRVKKIIVDHFDDPKVITFV